MTTGLTPPTAPSFAYPERTRGNSCRASSPTTCVAWTPARSMRRCYGAGHVPFDFFLVPDGDNVLIDVEADRAGALAQRLGMYRLRAKVAIEPTGLAVAVGSAARRLDGLRRPAPPGGRMARMRWRDPGERPSPAMGPLAPGASRPAGSPSACPRPASSAAR